ncbi:ribosome maturation factor RimM [Cardinium endosymbiont of Culicoides punctatus]|uniref:ribosome maturation factor RimM n=1 Tax=Cardinium endosymbiont of Culicoides punctatus TaxID=2304601 RepID=UPI0010589EA2|nr:hypothetical protein [Cardinium endosymbiont of Culicoides punctatus]TDG95487.1 Ribosome maturation factor RimM [Cardinium endosymbiont of Culicoides punctatus]
MSLFSIQLFYDSIQRDQYFHIGSFGKPIGINGEIIAKFLYELDESVLKKLPAFFVEREQIKVPYHINNISFKEGKAIVQLDLIRSKTVAYTLCNLPLFIPTPLKSECIKTAHASIPCDFLIDFLVHDTQLGPLGKVETIYPVQDQYILGIAYQNKELLVPYHREFIIKTDEKHKKITIQLPEGYLDAMQ